MTRCAILSVYAVFAVIIMFCVLILWAVVFSILGWFTMGETVTSIITTIIVVGVLGKLFQIWYSSRHRVQDL
jgi:hypothetical protein